MVAGLFVVPVPVDRICSIHVAARRARFPRFVLVVGQLAKILMNWLRRCATLASIENVQNVFTVEGPQGVIVVKQIAGLLARRIVFWKRLGDSLARGERDECPGLLHL